MSSTFQLYNTLTNRVEPVRPKEAGLLRMYSCGPTVYSYAHIGNFRSFLTADLIVRTARATGWDTRYVTNVTDVGHLTDDDVADASGEDRMAKALASEDGKRFANVWDLARHFTKALIEDWHALGLLEPDVRPRATEHIREQIRAVEQLVEKGVAYETSNAVYFSVNEFPNYGNLSGNVAAETLEESVRDVVSDPEKRDPRDFALWKKDEGHLMQWYSPWGWGFPGWHIECSVMASRYLGEELDIHAGGEDLIFPHHECEIAQAESLTERPFARHWVHTRFLQVEGKKMSKRAGNFYTVRDLVGPESEGGRGVDPMAVRLALISGHYRKPFNFTFDTLKASFKHVQRLREVRAIADNGADRVNGKDTLSEALGDRYEQALAAMRDDLNTPEALAAVLDGTKMILGAPVAKRGQVADIRAWLDNVEALLGIDTRAASPDDASAANGTEHDIDQLVAEREAARKSRDFARADEIREQLTELGIEVMDTPEGPRWKKAARI